MHWLAQWICNEKKKKKSQIGPCLVFTVSCFLGNEIKLLKHPKRNFFFSLELVLTCNYIFLSLLLSTSCISSLILHHMKHQLFRGWWNQQRQIPSGCRKLLCFLPWVSQGDWPNDDPSGSVMIRCAVSQNLTFAARLWATHGGRCSVRLLSQALPRKASHRVATWTWWRNVILFCNRDACFISGVVAVIYIW